MNKRDEVIKLTQKFIRTKTYSGQEKPMIEVLKEVFKKYSFDDYHIDDYGNIIGVIKGNKPGNKILLDSHVDTVDVANRDNWTVDPFGGEIINEKIYGRGSSDMKGALAAFIIATTKFAKFKNREFPGEIYISGGVHEECFEGIAAREVSKYVKPDYVIIGEASELDIKIGQKGRAEIIIEVFGESTHSATPEKGINAVYLALELIQKIQELEVTYDKHLGYGILELVDIKSSPYPGASVVPDYCKITYDRRLLVDETKEDVLKPLKKLIEKMKTENSNFNAQISYSIGEEKCWTGRIIKAERFFPAWRYEESEEFVQKAYKGIKEMGLNPKIGQYPFCTNGSHFAGEARIKTIGYGPSSENLAHTTDEYVEINQLLKAVDGYYGILNGLLK